MAFRALVKRILRHKKSGYVDQVDEFKKYLHQVWLYSLPEDKRKEYLAKQKRNKDNALSALSLMCALNLVHNSFT